MIFLADVAPLSACETQLAKNRVGSGKVVSPRLFLELCQTRLVVSQLWPVETQLTTF